jgi:hypothetical protein
MSSTAPIGTAPSNTVETRKLVDLPKPTVSSDSSSGWRLLEGNKKTAGAGGTYGWLVTGFLDLCYSRGTPCEDERCASIYHRSLQILRRADLDQPNI